MKKAKLRLNATEIAYCKKHGITPDRHYDKLLSDRCKNGVKCNECSEYRCGLFDEVGKIINDNVHQIWEEQKAKHAAEITFSPAGDTPF